LSALAVAVLAVVAGTNLVLATLSPHSAVHNDLRSGLSRGALPAPSSADGRRPGTSNSPRHGNRGFDAATGRAELAASAATQDPVTSPPDPVETFTDNRAWFGVLQAGGNRAAQEMSSGISVADFELSWGQYEPQPGVFNENYAAYERSRLAQITAAGQRVTLELGMNPPGWVLNLDPGARFMNQYGDVWQGTSSNDAANAVFDPKVRSAEAAYVAHVAADFGDSFFAVRAGGLLQDELRYPDATFNGHNNCYWAFDTDAQARSPVPGWRPGDPDTAKAAAFLDYYLSSITNYESWLLHTYRTVFPSAWLQVLFPSWGLRPGDTAAAVAHNLDGSTPPASWGTLEMGLDWQRQVASIDVPKVMLYSTWMERGDDGSSLQQLAPAHYLQALGSSRGFPVAGENASNTDSVALMRAMVQRVKSWGLAGLMWLDEPTLLGGGPVRLADYAAAITG
jgi:hypothetical protein